MFSWLKKSLPKPDKPSNSVFDLEFSTHAPLSQSLNQAIARSIQRGPPVPVQDGVAMDSDALQEIKANFNIGYQTISEATINWYGSQGFIGFQLCSIIAQNWLVDKVCTMPAKDAVRNWFEISVPEGQEISDDKLAALKDMDERFLLRENLVQAERFNRIFGIRIVMFKIESTDLEYYEKPFNIDGVLPGSYKGIVQIDPYWITPELSFPASSDPSAIDFYEPTWWRVNGKRIHKSHLVILKTSEVSDILKPTYFYGGIPVTQKIYERVYAAERTANEGPMLAMTKRLTTMKIDTAKAAMNPGKVSAMIEMWRLWRDNYGIKVSGLDEEINQFDTSLSDLDAVIMTQYQIVCAAGEVPSTKLLGTQPKGFNSTGEYEEASYHESLKSIQTHDLTPIVMRHHMLCIKSEISPGAPFQTELSWNPLDEATAKEKAEINLLKAQTGNALAQGGAIDGVDERTRITLDPNSGYANLPDIEREIIPDEDLNADAKAAPND
jgi:phage-related protein (TIGR01555 family)